MLHRPPPPYPFLVALHFHRCAAVIWHGDEGRTILEEVRIFWLIKISVLDEGSGITSVIRNETRTKEKHTKYDKNFGKKLPVSLLKISVTVDHNH